MSMAIFNSYVKLPEGKSAGYCGLLTNLLPLGLENESIWYAYFGWFNLVKSILIMFNPIIYIYIIRKIRWNP